MVDFGVIPKGRVIPMPKKNGHWEFPEEMGIGKVGFVYVIRDLVLRRGYIGKKFYRRSGVTRGGQEYPWRTYKSSSKTMSGLFSQRPIEEFDFYVLEEYSTKSGLSWAETWTQVTLKTPTTLTWYNTRVEKVAWRVNEDITFRHEQRLAEIQEWAKAAAD